MLWTLQARAMMGAGELEWNLTEKTPHRAGSLLNITFKITNSTANERQYKIYIGLFDLSGPVITTFPLPDTFTIGANSEQTFAVSTKIDYSNCILQASLYDVMTGEMGAALQTILEQPPNIIEQTSPVLMWMMVIGIIGTFMPTVLKD